MKKMHLKKQGPPVIPRGPFTIMAGYENCWYKTVNSQRTANPTIHRKFS